MIRGAPDGWPPNRLSALAGILGPAAFIVAWMSAGILTAGYSPANDAISRLAAVGAPTRALMTAGFVVYGAAIGAYGLILRRHLRGWAWLATTMSGAATLGVALFPLGTSPAADHAHNAMAGFGYLALVAAPLLAARPLADAGYPRAAIASLVAAALGGACLAATLVGPVHGLYQRIGLTVVDVWLMAGAVAIIGGSRGLARSDLQAHRSARS